MGSWNSICVTLTTREMAVDDLESDLRVFLDRDWQEVRADADVPELFDGRFEQRDLGLSEFTVVRRGGYVYCYDIAIGAFDGYDEFFHVLLHHVEPDGVAVKAKQFEGGPGGIYVFWPAANVNRERIERADPEQVVGMPDGYVELDRFENWDDDYGIDHAALWFDGEYEFPVGLPPSTPGPAYTLDVERRSLR